MSLEPNKIHWPSGSRIERFLGYLFNRLAAAFGGGRPKSATYDLDTFLTIKRSKKRRACVCLPVSDAYSESFDARTTSINAQTKIFKNEALSLLPLATSDASVIARQDENSSSRVCFFQVRDQTLSVLAKRASKLGIDELSLCSEAHPESLFPHPDLASRRHLERKSLTLGLAMCLMGAWSLLSVFEARSVETLRIVSAEETQLRAQLLDRLDENRELSALGQLAAINPEARAPQGRLQRLSDVTTATTDSTWWQFIEMDDLTLRMTGRSASAAATLTAVSNAFSGSEVTFSDAVSDAPNGEQIFTIEIRPGETLR